jgi:hypothetical protein
MLVYEPSISRRVGNKWESISPEHFLPAHFKSEECLRWDKVDWQSGEYDVVLNRELIIRNFDMLLALFSV